MKTIRIVQAIFMALIAFGFFYESFQTPSASQAFGFVVIGVFVIFGSLIYWRVLE